jgi:lipoate-protein ligase A
LGIDCSIQGICDLTLGAKKFSGNSLRCRRNFLLYHGTILYDFPLSMLGTCLGNPQRQPDYRQQRTHLEFVTNIEAAREEIVRALRSVWDAGTETATWPEFPIRMDLATLGGLGPAKGAEEKSNNRLDLDRRVIGVEENAESTSSK